MIKSTLRGIWRLVCPLHFVIGDCLRFVIRYPMNLIRFGSEFRRFRKMGGDASFQDVAPKLADRGVDTQTGGGEYFYQDVWCLRRIRDTAPAEHHDFGSRIDGFVGQLTALLPVVYWDIRVPGFTLPGLSMKSGDLCNLPIPDKSLMSVSCLHTAEHVGLGRYGDDLDPQGTNRAISELTRVLGEEGNLFFSMPLGNDVVEFNAHRRWKPETVVAAFGGLEVVELSAVDGEGIFHEKIRMDQMSQIGSGCGLYHFRATGS